MLTLITEVVTVYVGDPAVIYIRAWGTGQVS